LIEGIRAIKPKINVAIEPILPDSYGSWKNMARLTKANKNIGMKIVANAFPGYL